MTELCIQNAIARVRRAYDLGVAEPDDSLAAALVAVCDAAARAAWLRDPANNGDIAWEKIVFDEPTCTAEQFDAIIDDAIKRTK